MRNRSAASTPPPWRSWRRSAWCSATTSPWPTGSGPARQLERLFGRYLKISPKQYYTGLRLQRARNLLMQTDASIIDVAISCGFSNHSHFTRRYKQTYGTTPHTARTPEPLPAVPAG